MQAPKPYLHNPVARELAPAGLRSSPKPVNPVLQEKSADWFYDCCAAEREQAPSPRWFISSIQVTDPPPIPCGSGLARESGGPADINVECAGFFASKPAPTGSAAGSKYMIA
ncbi:hypothetical protein B0E42_24840 [Pseudomonas sp. A25(2017)]|nr:hypothetical protein B0E42_24840 [Pseudomonas sp. A25(2017)]